MSALGYRKKSDAGIWSNPAFILALLALFSTAFGLAFLASVTGTMRWWEAALIAGSLTVVVAALIWTVALFRRSHLE